MVPAIPPRGHSYLRLRKKGIGYNYFLKVVATSDSTNDFEQGFQKTNYLTVPYILTSGSYHRSAIMGDGKTRYSHDILNMAKSSSGLEDLEITFIGTIFSDDNMKQIVKIDSNTYFFDSHNGNYSGVNVEKGIKNFTFNFVIGITVYTDDRNVKWTRK